MIFAAPAVCVALAASPIYSKPAKDAVAGKVHGKVIGEVVARDGARNGDWLQVRVDELRPFQEHTVARGEVSFWVPKSATRAAKCPPGATMAMLEAMSNILELSWPDGGEAGSVHLEDAWRDAARSSEYQDRGGARFVCFDREHVAGLTVHVCGACETLQHGSGVGFGPGLGSHEKQKLPCE